MLLWIFILFILSLLNFFYDIFILLGTIKPLDPFYVSFFDILFLLITLGILYRMYYLQRKGEREKLKAKIKELEDEIKKLKGE